MSDAVRDNNRIPSGLGVSSADSITPTLFAIDPITGRLLTDETIEAVTVTAGTPITRENNRIPVGYGYDYDNGVLIPLYIKSGSGLLVDLAAE